MKSVKIQNPDASHFSFNELDVTKKWLFCSYMAYVLLATTNLFNRFAAFDFTNKFLCIFFYSTMEHVLVDNPFYISV